MSTPTSVSDSVPTTSNGQASENTPQRVEAWQVAHNLGASFRYAGEGIFYALRTQRNFRIHALATIVVIALGIGLHLPRIHVAVLGLTCGAVMALELINTALEAIVDLVVKQTYHELAKIAKDCAAGAVLIAALMAILVGGCIILPPLIEALQPVVQTWWRG